ncbi:succinate dehydrogenase, hydrophobic membrane anchor protein [Desulfosoma caldarium]|uniref:Succinate dehydrogenase hydrophobic membrane anchor subunit n=1 Tax=Desulfosoma caldarium TaxID=610254 RepID=A0A3N1VT48_9BACT|nr:succinate dehydrogenase, hydrophobic membrane anchor protein [Desulfosoma caldarium]ROR03007.1 succinate dehydrogenase / fumarate reductase cytochrome b subunit/succinate dehydrogenase / fumarate reductase membrane anchor subunit [Desulfosoma caldarium]
MLGKSFGSGRSGAFDWFFQRVSGVALLITLFLHFWVLHYATQGPVTYQKVMARLVSPAWKALDIAFLVFAVYHAMNGFKMILDDYVHAPGLRAVLVGALWVVAIGFFGLGLLTIVTLKVQA